MLMFYRSSCGSAGDTRRASSVKGVPYLTNTQLSASSGSCRRQGGGGLKTMAFHWRQGAFRDERDGGMSIKRSVTALPCTWQLLHVNVWIIIWQQKNSGSK